MKKLSVKTAVRVLAATAIVAAAVGVSTPSADAAVIDRGCTNAQLSYSDVSSYRVCSWALDYSVNGVGYYAYVDQWETYSSYANGQLFGWHWTAQRTFVYQSVSGGWVKHSCVWRWPNGAAQNC